MKIEDILKEKVVLDKIADIITVLDMNLKFIYISPAVFRIRGFIAEEAMAQNIEQVLTPESLLVLEKTFKEEMELETKRTADLERSRTIELEHYRKDGSLIWMELSLSFFRENKKPVAIIAVSRDITDRKRATDDLKQSTEQLRKVLKGTVQAIVALVEARDPYTAGHQRRVADLARAIAQEMKLPYDQVDGLRMAATIHDIGKISIPAEILSKPKKLSDIEYGLIKSHSQCGFNVLKKVEFPWPVARMVLEHHERMNGTGYPNGLTGEKTLLESRILMVADVVEAMASHRPHRPAVGINKVLEEIVKNKGILYDPIVVDACLRLFQDEGYHLLKLKET